MHEHSSQTEKAWDWVRLALVAVLLLAVLGIILISAGIFDPKPLGYWQEQFQLSPIQTGPGETNILWLQEPIVSGVDTYRLNAAFQAGSIDSGYGLAIGDTMEHIIIAVSPTGYVSIQRYMNTNEMEPAIEQIFPWQVWPHVQKGQGANEIWVDVVESQITTIRINRELLWGKIISVDGKKIGLYSESFDGATTTDFQTLDYYSG